MVTPIELRRQGLMALRKELGYVETVRFLQQFDFGNGDYTEERHQWQDHLTVDDIMQQVKQLRGQKLEKEISS